MINGLATLIARLRDSDLGIVELIEQDTANWHVYNNHAIHIPTNITIWVFGSHLDLYIADPKLFILRYYPVWNQKWLIWHTYQKYFKRNYNSDKAKLKKLVKQYLDKIEVES